MGRIDIVLFGATGFTGKFVAKELAKLNKKDNFTWAIAGRSQLKLNELLNDLKKNDDLIKESFDLNKVESIIVDINDANTIKNMCEKAKIIINCVGPYRFYGEAVVKECVKTKTHHIDVSGEPEFQERMQLNYNKAASESNIYIVGACGFDSVPADLGLLYTKNEFPGELNHVESYLTIETNGAPFSLNYATWESAVYGFSSAKSLGPIRRQLFQVPLPNSPYKPKKMLNLLGYFYNSYLKKYAMQFQGSDKAVVQRSQYLNYVLFNKRPIQYSAYFTLDKLSYCYKFIFWGLVVTILARYKLGRRILIRYYNFFSRGLAKKKDGTEEELTKMRFRKLFFGYGWRNKLEDPNKFPSTSPDTTIITQVTGPEVGYVSASIIVANIAHVLLRESDKIPVKGGVLTPAIAFGNTSLIQKLNDSGIEFKNLTKSVKQNSNL